MCVYYINISIQMTGSSLFIFLNTNAVLYTIKIFHRIMLTVTYWTLDGSWLS